MDSTDGQEYDVIEARRRGLIDLYNSHYINPATKGGRRMSIDDAIEEGFVKAEFESYVTEPTIETKT